MSGELLLSFSRTKPTRIIRERTTFKITPTTIRAWFTLHCPHIIEPTDAINHRAIYVFKTLLHRADGCENDDTYVIWREFHMCRRYPDLTKKETFECLFFRSGLRVCNKNPNARDASDTERKLVDIILNDSDYELFMSYWPTKPTYVDILTTIMLISRRLLSGSQYWYEFPREIVEKIVCL
jgi:hypothetical protein